MTTSPTHLNLLLQQQRYEEALQELLPHISDKQSTRLNVLSGWRNYIKWLEKTEESLLHPKSPEIEYPQWLQRQDVAPSTLNMRLIQVRKLYTLLLELELVQQNPFIGKKGVHNPVEERREIYSPEEVERLLAHADAEERLLVLLGVDAGLSSTEVRGLKFSHYDSENHTLQLERVRYREQEVRLLQTIPCTQRLIIAFEKWLKEKGQTPLYHQQLEGFVFTLQNQTLTNPQLLAKLYQLCQRANVTYKPWRALKHVAGVQRLAAGVKNQEVKQVLAVQRLEVLRKKAGIEDGRKTRWKKNKE